MLKPDYHPVTRTVTIEFGPVPPVVTPETIVARSGDTIEWNVQGADHTRVSIGNFKPRDAKKPHPPKTKPGNPRAAETLDADEDASFKYDILLDGNVEIDPDVEIRGPKA